MPEVTVRPAEPRDVPTLLELFAALAEYEHLTHELRASEQGLHDALFSENPAAYALIAEGEGEGEGEGETPGEGEGEAPGAGGMRGAGEALGYALYFRTFSSFLTSTGVWLEDLFVRPEHRGEGVGFALLGAVAASAVREGGERLEWAALDWNELALGFYRRIGAETMNEWITHRLTGEALATVAGGGR